MIPYHCDSLLSPEDRNKSDKFRAIASPRTNIYKLHPVYAQELVAFLGTPGITHEHFQTLFGWEYRTYQYFLQLTQFPRPDLTEVNMQRMDLETGRALLVNIMANDPTRRRIIPHWSVLYLKDELRRQGNLKHLAKELNISATRLLSWAKSDNFDPLTLQRRPDPRFRRYEPQQQRFFV